MPRPRKSHSRLCMQTMANKKLNCSLWGQSRQRTNNRDSRMRENRHRRRNNPRNNTKKFTKTGDTDSLPPEHPEGTSRYYAKERERETKHQSTQRHQTVVTNKASISSQTVTCSVLFPEEMGTIPESNQRSVF